MNDEHETIERYLCENFFGATENVSHTYTHTSIPLVGGGGEEVVPIKGFYFFLFGKNFFSARFFFF